MDAHRFQVIEARLNVLGTVLQAVCQSLEREQAAAVLSRVREQVASDVSLGLTAATDEGTARELAPILGVLHATASSAASPAMRQ